MVDKNPRRVGIMKSLGKVGIVAAVAAVVVGLAFGKAEVSPKADLKWTELGPGVSAASLDGDMAKGPSHFYLKYKAGLVTPVHHHSADHYVATISGNLTIIA